MQQNKKIWFSMETEIWEKMSKLSKEQLNLPFSEFVRSCVFSTYLEILEKGIESVTLKPTHEGNIKKIIVEKGGSK